MIRLWSYGAYETRPRQNSIEPAVRPILDVGTVTDESRSWRDRCRWVRINRGKWESDADAVESAPRDKTEVKVGHARFIEAGLKHREVNITHPISSCMGVKVRRAKLKQSNTGGFRLNSSVLVQVGRTHFIDE